MTQFTKIPSVRLFLWVFGRLTLLYSAGFGFLTFGLVKTKYWIGPVKSLYFIGYIFYFIIWPILHQVLLKVLPLRKEEDKCPTTTDVTTNKS
ncbi:hypothetical protein TELCIR_06253 [Teladorsagia circumcincta]|uniref:Uncharacterized protein n=1 Tax=Teladorsagia circumcincta TaxID=45464 RepID=A0A2G9UQU5_TELCI|nr:hypothetical protein TELCIR_06253 [Teladorsagia circumcincta]